MEEFPQLSSKHYHEIKHELRSGDILLCAGSSLFSNLIRKSTGSVWSHVAFILRVEPINRIMVLESVESIGVRAIPLSSYVSDYNGTRKGYPGSLLLARHQHVKEENIVKLSKHAVDLLGYPYRQEEILHIAARLTIHSLGLPDSAPDTVHRRAFICSEYAQTCFASIGINIACNALGFISPADFYRDPHVTPLFYLRTQALAHEPEHHGVKAHLITDAIKFAT